ncbi:MAG: hypothetical protein H6Q42_4650 [Deltaproteobacteria bacterium]|nr:hypothetical protein [Deltaproteobacteria bacterium]
MKVRAGGPSRGSHPAQLGSLGDLISYADLRFRQVEIHGVEPPTMVQDDRFSGKEKIVDQGDLPAIAGPYGSSLLGPQVNTGMGTLRLAVDDPPRSKGPGQFPLHRADKGSLPCPFIAELLE